MDEILSEWEKKGRESATIAEAGNKRHSCRTQELRGSAHSLHPQEKRGNCIITVHHTMEAPGLNRSLRIYSCHKQKTYSELEYLLQ